VTDRQPVAGTPLPIACTLPLAEQQARGEDLRELSAEATSWEATATGVILRFEATPGMDARLRQVAAAEAQCCPFLRLDVTCEGGRVVLAVAGPDEARKAIEAMFLAPVGT
jgi:hypothetical protein